MKNDENDKNEQKDELEKGVLFSVTSTSKPMLFLNPDWVQELRIADLYEPDENEEELI